jgi:hypothetical protein
MPRNEMRSIVTKCNQSIYDKEEQYCDFLSNLFSSCSISISSAVRVSPSVAASCVFFFLGGGRGARRSKPCREQQSKPERKKEKRDALVYTHTVSDSSSESDSSSIFRAEGREKGGRERERGRELKFRKSVLHDMVDRGFRHVPDEVSQTPGADHECLTMMDGA